MPRKFHWLFTLFQQKQEGVLTTNQRQTEQIGIEHALLGEVVTCLMVEFPYPALDLHDEIESLLVQQVESQEPGGRGERCCWAARGQGGAHRAQAGAHDPRISNGGLSSLTYNRKEVKVIILYESRHANLFQSINILDYEFVIYQKHFGKKKSQITTIYFLFYRLSSSTEQNMQHKLLN